MRTVHLLTFHGSVNYGAVLQAYALHKAIMDAGAPCLVIDYNRITHHRNYLKIPKSSLKGYAYLLSKWPAKWKLHRKFDRFTTSNMRLTKTFNGYPAMSKTDFESDAAFVVGSDQIWNCQMTNDNTHYYLDFTESKNKYSYAASLGVSDIADWKNKETLGSLLRDFRAISVREESAADILQQEFGLSSTVVCDPTFLLTADRWSSIIPRMERKPYVVLFMFNNNETVIRAARELADAHQLELVNIAYMVKHVEGAKNVSNLSPEEWLAYIKNASYVFTDSFHGFALSLNFNKQVWVALSNTKRNSRILDLANRYGIAHRIVTDTVSKTDIDYVAVNEKIDADRQHSLNFLQEILHDANCQ